MLIDSSYKVDFAYSMTPGYEHFFLSPFFFHYLQFKSTHVTAIPAKMVPLALMILTTFPNTNVSVKTGSLGQTVKVIKQVKTTLRKWKFGYKLGRTSNAVGAQADRGVFLLPYEFS